MTAAEAARSEGRIAQARTRYLRAAVDLVEAREALVVLERRFGNVEIHVKGKRVTALIPSKAPFAPDAKAAIERYHEEVSVDRTFEVGFLSVPIRWTAHLLRSSRVACANSSSWSEPVKASWAHIGGCSAFGADLCTIRCG